DEHFDGEQNLEFEFENGRWESRHYYPFGWMDIEQPSKAGAVI
ncbi:MAG: hypothetical protein RL021_1324, partial [Bacteroidota bacterium]